jgi:hypothetical protein
VCELMLSSASVSDSLTFDVASNSANLKVPAQIGTRTGQRGIRFLATADPAATGETVTIEARGAEISVQETLAISAPGRISLNLPDHLMARHGSTVHFTATARDGQKSPAGCFSFGPTHRCGVRRDNRNF